MITNSYPVVSFRYRLVGEMWQPNFMQVVKVTDKGAYLKDEAGKRIILLSDLRLIIHCELDGSLHSLEPNFHYEVSPD